MLLPKSMCWKHKHISTLSACSTFMLSFHVRFISSSGATVCNICTSSEDGMPLDPILGLNANTIVLVDVDYQAASFRMNLLALPQRDKNEREKWI